MCQRSSLRADRRVEARAISCPLVGKLSLRPVEPQVGLRHEDVERKWEYHIIIFPERTWNLHKERRGKMNTVLMEHFNSILFHKSEPANKQHTY